MTHVVELYWSFRSPYSYLVTPRLIDQALYALSGRTHRVGNARWQEA